ncbi:MAG: YqaE/Pmp3 family membrane protein [Cryomorphaceae bacterium]|nr:YqaE/Pmp3 family membrane protein [Cryomorphaceae bacterium]
MKIPNLFVASTFAITLVLSSCGVSSDVVSDRGIQKRKYRKGYFVVKPEQKPDAETTYLEPIEINRTVNAILVERETPEMAAIAPTKTADKKSTSPNPLSKDAPTNATLPAKVGATEFHELASMLKKQTLAFETTKAEKSEKPMDDQELVLFLILAILLPWLAMILLYGVGKEFLISLLLWFVFLLPGIVYAVIMVLRKLG